MNSPYPRIGKTMRKGFGYSQTDLGKLLNKQFGLSSIRNYEHGERDAPASYLLALSNLYQCTIQDLFDDTIEFHMYSNIETTLYSYVNHVSQFTKPEKMVGYQYDSNIDIAKYRYQYFMILDDDLTLNLPRHSRVLVQMKEKEKIDVTEHEQMFLITVSKRTHPEYGYNYLKEDNKNTELKSQREESKSYITRAWYINDITNGNYVMYYDNTTIRYMGYREFLNAIDGVVIKVVYDNSILIHNKHDNLI